MTSMMGERHSPRLLACTITAMIFSSKSRHIRIAHRSKPSYPTQSCPRTLATPSSERRTRQGTNSAPIRKRPYNVIHTPTSAKSKPVVQTGTRKPNGISPRLNSPGGSWDRVPMMAGRAWRRNMWRSIRMRRADRRYSITNC